MINLFAAETGPAIHVAPAVDFRIFGWPITNSMIWGWTILLVLIVLMTLAARKLTIKPKGGVLQYLETGVEFATDTVVSAFNDKTIGRKYVPFFVTIFFFVLLNNWAGLIPGVGEALQKGGHPFFRPFTADLNGTIAMGVVTMGFVYWASIKEVGGIKNYLRHFFAGSLKNPLYFVIGIIEMVTDLTRALSLALRLFLNVTIGEIVIGVFAYLGGLLVPGNILAPIAAAPFTLLELGVGALQAYIFVVLGANYLAIAVNSAHDHDAHQLDSAQETDTIVSDGKVVSGAH